MSSFLSRRRWSAALSVLLLIAIALLPVSNLMPTHAQQKLKVVATHSILADLVKNVAGDLVEVTALVPPDGDAHTFEPTPQDIVALKEAALVFENGLGFELWLDKAFESSGSKATRVRVTDGIQPLAVGSTVRLLVADHEARPVQLVDLGNGQTVGTYDVKAPTYVYSSPSGRFGVMIQINANLVTAVDSGVVMEDHGDHFHVYKNDPVLTDFVYEGATPIHFTPHEGQFAIFNDASGMVTLLTERNLRLKDEAILTFNSGRPHHGAAVPLGDKVLVTVATTDLDNALPIGVELRDLQDKMLQRFEGCPGLHGEAAIGNYVAFGCSDGVLIIEKQGETFTAKKISSAPGTPDNVRVGTVIGHEAQSFFFGNYGPTGLVRIDPAAGTMTPIELPLRYSGFEFDAETGKTILVVTADGSLHSINAMTGAIINTLKEVVAPFSFRRNVPRPGLLTVHHFAYLTDPASGEVVEVDVEAMAITRRFAVGGKPVRLAAIGLLEAEEAGDDAHEHAGSFDPHVWHDLTNAQKMVTAIRDALIRADAANAPTYRANAKAYGAKLTDLDKFVKEQVATLPAERRLLVTPHNTFGYFAERYGFKIVGTALGSLSTKSGEPSPRELAELVEEIKEAGVPAIFPENISNMRLMEQIASEAGITLAPALYTDALGKPGSPAEDYLSLIRYNITTIVTALK